MQRESPELLDRTPSPPAGVRLAGEFLLLYWLAPLLMALAIYGLRVPLFMLLLPVLLVFVVLLLRDPGFHVLDMLRTGIPWRELASILMLLPVGAALIFAVGYWLEPDRVLEFPRQRPGLWLIIMIAYPLVSVTTQEILFRVYFYHRFERLFGDRPMLAILANGAAFAFAHILFWNWVSPLMSFFGGMLFAWRYQRSRSYWAAVLEHSLYGDLIFTAGLGLYFFTGVSNVSF